ncbi:DNA-binding response regulator, OmpR family, contains REC and winged-helix (wHTH) domain [Lachnospiraceae bacterium NE2001]|nr:DNA-binding response regulator, OmpR family, contains REC and winged-helix (wHTH) domain [Lachnospiraceae bacterium NE2001]
MTDILIIEDNEDLGGLIADFLRREGWSVTLTGSAEEGLELLEKEVFKLLLLDVMLPGKDGFETLTEIRKTRSMPVIIMSAKNDDESMILGIEIGADDYVDKSVSIPVLTSKIKAIMRRTYEAPEDKQILSVDGITVDVGARTVYKNNEKIDIMGKEFDLLVYLMENRGKALRKETIFDNVWGESCFSELSSLSVYISWLRDKIEDDPKKPKYIKTVYKVGYQFGEV